MCRVSPRAVLLVLLALHAAPQPAAAQDAPGDTPTVAWRTSIKAAGLVSRAPHAPELFPRRNGAEALWRIRTEPTVTIGSRTVVHVAYEQRVRWASAPTGLLAAAILPGAAVTAFRVTPLEWNLATGHDYIWQHGVDRLSVSVSGARTDITVGRQAIGWGRGVVFGAVDLFAPFSPIEADREWRRGIDAVHADVTLTDRASVDVVAAPGTRWEASALAARLRGFAGSLDLEVMGGRRGQDVFGGMATSAAVGDAAVHGELAFFRTPTNIDRHVWKAVAGGSYRFPLGSGVLTYAEYHYSGFGASRPEEILPLLATPDFRHRYLRGDTQILSRHAAAVTGAYEHTPDLTWSGLWLLNPIDRSGIVAPGFTFIVKEDILLDGNAYVPYGRAPAGVQVRSEYGTAPLAAFLQLRVYF